MNLGQAIIEALESLSSNKLRSGLTILGIVIGVAAVIAMLAVGHGAESTITGSITGMGTNLLFVFSGGQNVDNIHIEPLTLSDADALADPFQVPSVEKVASIIQGSVIATYAGNDSNTTVIGITPTYQEMSNYTVTEGELIDESHVLGRASVVVIGVDVAKDLFDREEGVIGETIRLSGQPFKVIGLLSKKGGSAFGSQDDLMMIPFSTAQMRLLRRGNRENVDMIYVQATSSEAVKQAQEEISQVLRNRHNCPLGVDDFMVYSQEDIVSTAKTVTSVLTIFLGGIAGISLLVGGIGIMNIMLVSVTERTREIGLRKALGARRKDILTQFLTESVLLSFFGGLLGIGFGFLIAFAIEQIATMSGTPFKPVVGMDAILLATIFSTAVGLFFGLYPANRAAGLVPVEALRYE